ncbi:MAG: hypothetical protein FWD46_06600 [Cystobacterineae bacterium]|nr:hypothetical protein [Cystobacterineae bacterium]
MPLYSEHRTVSAAPPVERTALIELDDGARLRRIAALEREAYEQSKAASVSFAQVLESKQDIPPR